MDNPQKGSLPLPGSLGSDVYKSKFVKVRLYREDGKPEHPIETTYGEWGIENILIPVNQDKSNPIVGYQIDNGPIKNIE